MTALAPIESRIQTLVADWWASHALPIIEATETWPELDELEEQVRPWIAIFETANRDTVVELEKALRCIEARRGRLAGINVGRGHRTDLTARGKVPDDISPTTLARYRQMARSWDVLRQHLSTTHDVREVTQAACLRVARAAIGDDPEVSRVELHDLTAEVKAFVRRIAKRWPEERHRDLARLLTELAATIAPVEDAPLDSAAIAAGRTHAHDRPRVPTCWCDRCAPQFPTAGVDPHALPSPPTLKRGE
jgi:hypothetical protein